MIRRIIPIISILILVCASALDAFVSIVQVSGPNNYSSIIGDIYVPISDKSSVDASYTSSSFPGLPNRISYGAEVRAGTGKGTDIGAGFILSPEVSSSKYSAWDVSGGYSFGSRDLNVRLGLYFQDTSYEENPAGTVWHALSQYEYCPSARITILKNIKVGVNTAIFNYSDDLKTFTGSIDSMALRNNRDLGAIVGVVADLPKQTQTLSIAYRVAQPLEVYGEWSKIDYQRIIPSDNLTSYGVRYFFSEYFAFSVNFVNYNSQAYNTLGFGVFW